MFHLTCASEGSFLVKRSITSSFVSAIHTNRLSLLRNIFNSSVFFGIWRRCRAAVFLLLQLSLMRSKFACMTAKCALFSYLLSNLFPRAICNAAVKLHRFHINWILSSLTIRILLLDTLRGASRGSSPRAGLIESAASCTLCALLLSLQIIHRIRLLAVKRTARDWRWTRGEKWWRSLEGADFHSCAAAPSSRSDSCQTHFTLLTQMPLRQ